MSSTHSSIMSPWLGEIQWDTGSELDFPGGLPGFEQHTRMVPVEIPSQRPIVYLQSVLNAAVCFLTLPVLTVHPDFRLRISEDDRGMLGLEQNDASAALAPLLGTDVICLALLVPSAGTVQTNLDAPIVVNLHNHRGIQAVGTESVAGVFRLSPGGRWQPAC